MTACRPSHIIAFPAKKGPLKVFFAVDTEETCLALKCVSRGIRWGLPPKDIYVVGVTSYSLKDLGIVRLTISIGKHTPIISLDFYVASNFPLQADGLLGLPSLRFIRMATNPETSTVKFLRERFRAMDFPLRLACLAKQKTRTVEESHVLAASAVPTDNGTYARWKTVNAVVIRDREIP